MYSNNSCSSNHEKQQQHQYQHSQRLAKAFIQYCWSENHKGREIPLISIVPEFKVTPDDTDKIAFLLYPMSLFSEEKSGEIIKKLATCIHEFQSKVILGEIQIKDCVLEKPIR